MPALYRWEAVDPSFILNTSTTLAALYQNELLLYLLHRYEAHADLFDAYDRSLSALAAGDRHDIVLRRFEVSLLRTLGYGPSWDRDVHTGEPIQADNWYYYEADSGPRQQPLTESGLPISRPRLALVGRPQRCL